MMQQLDRRITIQYEGPGGARNEFGEYVPGQTVNLTVWAQRYDLSAQDIEREGGVTTSARRDWRVRWTAALAGERLSDRFASLMVVDGGVTFNVTNVIELVGRDGLDRRRWLRFSGVYTT